LQVAYADSEGAPIAGGTVSFALLGEAGGATLQSPETVTGEDGLARMELNAGFEEAFFQVEATAEGAGPVRYSVAVSNAGFGALDVGLLYAGQRSDEELASITLRLYAETTCRQLDPVEEGSPHKIRTLASFDERAQLGFLPLDAGHAVSAVGADEEGHPLVWGCVDIISGRLREGIVLSTELPVSDTYASPAEGYVVHTDLYLNMEANEIREALRPWLDMGSCPYGPAQALLDCLVGAVETPSAEPSELSCQEAATTPLAVEITSLRGVLSGRCRSALDANGMDSLEKTLQDEGTVQEQIARLQSLEADGGRAVGHLQLVSYLAVVEDPPGGWLGTHRLWAARFPDVFNVPSYQASQLMLPAIEARLISLFRTPQDPERLLVAPHELTVRPSRLIRLALVEAYLAGRPVTSTLEGLEELWQPEQLGAEQACSHIDEIVCAATRRQDGCVLEACQLAMGALAHRLEAGLTELEAEQADLIFSSGHATMIDSDHDLEAESLGTQEAPGEWEAEVWLGQHSQEPTAVFTGHAPVTPIE
jgi:hypothetical protein